MPFAHPIGYTLRNVRLPQKRPINIGNYLVFPHILCRRLPEKIRDTCCSSVRLHLCMGQIPVLNAIFPQYLVGASQPAAWEHNTRTPEISQIEY